MTAGDDLVFLGKPWRPIELAGVLALAVWLVFSGGLGGALLFDDIYWIKDNPDLRVLWPPANLRRPLGYLTLQLNYALHGESVWGYHAANILIHAAATVVLFDLVRRSLKLPGVAANWQRHATPLALAVALLWGLHPLQTGSVTYIIQRLESQMGLCFLLSLYCLVRGAVSSRGWPWLIGSWVAFVAALATKEVAAAAPLVALLYDRAFLAGTWRQVLRRRGWLYLAMLPPLAWLAWMQRGTLAAGDASAAGFGYEAISPWEYLRTQPGVILHYLRLTILPDQLCFDYGWPVANSPWEIYPAGLAILSMLAASFWAVVRMPRLGVVGLAFFLILAPTSSVMPIADLAFEHRMYLPLACVALLAVMAAHAILTRCMADEPTRRRLAVAMVLAAAGALSWRTIARNQDYRDPLTMWSQTARAAPHNPRAHVALAQCYISLQKWDEAERELALAEKCDPRHAHLFLVRGDLLVRLGRIDAALADYRQAIALKPRYGAAWLHLAKVEFFRRKSDREALAAAQQVIAVEPDFRDGKKFLARVLATTSDESIRNPQRAIQILREMAPQGYAPDREWLELMAAAQAAAN